MRSFTSMKTIDVKNQNKVSVLHYIYHKGITSRTDLVNDLGLSKPTVSQLVHELVLEGYLTKVGIGNSTTQGGKPPQLYDFNALRGAAVAIHIGISHIQGALVDLRLNVLERLEMSYDKEQPRQAMEAVVSIIGRLLSEAKGRPLPVFGIGVSVPGIVRSNSGTLINAVHLKQWSNMPIGRELEERFGLPVRVDNATRNIALAEKWAGLGRKLSTFITVQTVGGLGTGIFLNGSIYRGADDSGGEFGHTTVDFNGPACGCGNRGCWELYASHEAFTARLLELLPGCPDSLLARRLASGERLDLRLIGECRAAGDSFAREQAEQYAAYLGIGIVNLVNVFYPELIILQGHLKWLGDSFLEDIRKLVAGRAIASGGGTVRLAFSDFKEETKMIGAASLVVKEVIEGRHFQ